MVDLLFVEDAEALRKPGIYFMRSYTTSKCAGGEVRGVLRITADHVRSDGYVGAYVEAYLYEGTTCSTNDKDGYDDWFVWIPPNESRTVRLGINARGGNVDVTLVLANYPA